jgi:hypothetical protein
MAMPAFQIAAPRHRSGRPKSGYKQLSTTKTTAHTTIWSSQGSPSLPIVNRSSVFHLDPVTYCESNCGCVSKKTGFVVTAIVYDITCVFCAVAYMPRKPWDFSSGINMMRTGRTLGVLSSPLTCGESCGRKMAAQSGATIGMALPWRAMRLGPLADGRSAAPDGLSPAAATSSLQ